MKMLRPEESRAADAVQQWLIENGWNAKWSPGPDPPDVDILIDFGEAKVQWACEVTRLFAFVDWGGEKTDASLESLAAHVCDRLTKVIPQDCPHGYLLSISAPFPMTLLGEIENRAAAYIKSGEAGEEFLDYQEHFQEETRYYPPEALDPATLENCDMWAKAKSKFIISQLENGERKVISATHFHAMAKTPDGALAGDIKSQLNFTVKRALDNKLPILKKIPPGYDWKLIVFSQDYFFAEPDRLREAVREYGQELSGVDSIFFVDDNGQAHLI